MFFSFPPTTSNKFSPFYLPNFLFSLPQTKQNKRIIKHKQMKTNMTKQTKTTLDKNPLKNMESVWFGPTISEHGTCPAHSIRENFPFPSRY